jgi:hypothetical protein
VVSDLAGVKKAVEFVGAQVKTPPATPDKFFTVMSEFYNKASQQVSMLDTKLKKTEEAFAKTAEYFGEQANTPAEQLFNTVWAAVQALERAKVRIPHIPRIYLFSFFLFLIHKLMVVVTWLWG